MTDLDKVRAGDEFTVTAGIPGLEVETTDRYIVVSVDLENRSIEARHTENYRTEFFSENDSYDNLADIKFTGIRDLEVPFEPFDVRTGGYGRVRVTGTEDHGQFLRPSRSLSGCLGYDFIGGYERSGDRYRVFDRYTTRLPELTDSIKEAAKIAARVEKGHRAFDSISAVMEEEQQ